MRYGKGAPILRFLLAVAMSTGVSLAFLVGVIGTSGEASAIAGVRHGQASVLAMYMALVYPIAIVA